MNYAKHLTSRKVTPQTEPIPGTAQVPNAGGGYAFAIDNWGRLDRWLILGSEGGSYYASERSLTKDNAKVVQACLAEDGVRAVRRIVEISKGGRAPKNDASIFALAMAASSTDLLTKKAAFAALPDVCRIPTHLFAFVEAAEVMRGWGRSMREGVADWYKSKDAKNLAFQVSKYQSRNGWSHRDLLRLAHPKFADGTDHAIIANWAVKGWPGVGDTPHDREAVLPIWAFEKAKRATSADEIIRLILDYRLVRECVPTEYLKSPEVWEALLVDMPMTAMIRNLATMTRVGLLTPMSAAARLVKDRLNDAELIRKARIHPLAALVALKTYQQGHGERGSNTWSPVQQVVDALDAAFYLAFKAVEPTNKRFLLGVDVSGSMDTYTVAGMTGITPRIGAAALALVTAATEQEHLIMGFSHYLVGLNISPRQRLDDVIATMQRVVMGSTNCSLPMTWALQSKVPIDVFVVLTDNECNTGSIHACQALRQYRDQMDIPAKLVVVGMVSGGFTIADPNDRGMMDCVGMDTNLPEIIRDFIVN